MAALPNRRGPLKEVADWTERYRHIWEERLDRLDKYLQQVKAKEEKSHGRRQRGKPARSTFARAARGAS